MDLNTSGILSTGGNIRPIAHARQCAQRRSPIWSRGRFQGRSRILNAAALALLGISLAACDSSTSASGVLNDAGNIALDVLGFERTPSGPGGTTVNGAGTLNTQYLGTVAADDTQAVDLARRVLLGGGDAADAATTIALALSVTEPGRAGLDGGGICLVKPGESGPVEELDFLPQSAAGGTVPVPGLIRGLAALQGRFGALHWQQDVSPVEALATTGITVTPALLADLQAAGLGNGGPGGRPLVVGDVLPQHAVSATLAQLRLGGAADFYTGSEGSALVGDGVPAKALAAYAPTWRPPASLSAGTQLILYPQGPAGAAIQAAWQAAQGKADPAARFAAARAAAFASGQTGIDRPSGSVGFLVADASGQAVSCAIGMGKPFGTGQVIEPMGIFASAPFTGASEASLAPMLSVDSTNGQLMGAVVGAGSYAAPADAAAVAWGVLAGNRPVGEAVADPRTPAETLGTLAPDRVSALSCPGGLPGQSASCTVQHDPRGGGYSMHVDKLLN